MHIDTNFWIGVLIFILVVALVGVCIVYRDLLGYMRDNEISVSEFVEDFDTQHEDFWDYKTAKTESEIKRKGTVYAEQEEWRETHKSNDPNSITVSGGYSFSIGGNTEADAWAGVNVDTTGDWSHGEPACKDVPRFGDDPDWVRDCKKYFPVGLRRCLVLRQDEGEDAQEQCYCDYRPNRRYPENDYFNDSCR